MIIEHCEFPDDLLYDHDGHIWVSFDPDRRAATIGLTSLLASIAGRVSSLRIKRVGEFVARGRSLGTVEGPRMVGPIPSPLSGEIIERNDAVSSNPKLLNNAPYKDGWIVRLSPADYSGESGTLVPILELKDLVKQRIAEFRVKCFKRFPDHQMYEVGSECRAVLVRLNEWIEKIPEGDVIHLVSDDPTSYVEMVIWSEKTGNELVEVRSEGQLQHFILTKGSATAALHNR